MPQPKNHLLDSQLAQFPKILQYIDNALKHNRFYQRKFQSAGVSTSFPLSNLTEFSQLPFTTKQELVHNQLQTPPFGTNISHPLDQYIYVASTSGTSGNRSLTTPFTLNDIKGRLAQSAMIKKLLPLTGRPSILPILPHKEYYYYVNELQEMGFRVYPPLSVNADEYLLNYLLENRIEALLTTPTKLSQLTAAAIKSNHPSLKTPFVRLIILAGEPDLGLPAYRKYMEHFWSARCLNLYGSTEAGKIAFECLAGQGFHLLHELTYFEIINPHTQSPSNSGELVVTPLWRTGFPLIRYRTGDWVEIDNTNCVCGIKGPKIKASKLARLNEIICLPEKEILPIEIESIISSILKNNRFSLSLDNFINPHKLVIIIYTDSIPKISSLSMLKHSIHHKMGILPRIIISKPYSSSFGNWKTKKITLINKSRSQKSKIPNQNPTFFLSTNLLAKIINKIKTSLLNQFLNL